ncbi:MAG TPA: endolytic transglycosylase MltG [Gaiellaceae bacterium]|nr:endolytic transglycosylase MltG [Gaiellaceae bacterium]
MLLLAFFGLALFLGVTALGRTGGGSEAEQAPPTTTGPPPLPTFRIVFPEGFTRKDMVARVGAVRQIAEEERNLEPTITQKGYDAATQQARVPVGFREDARGIEGFLFPATYELTTKTTARELVADQLAFFEENWKKVDLTRARERNLTPYDVLIIASMVEKETVVPDERPLVAAVIYNRLRIGMPLGIDATIRYGLDVPGTESLRQSHLSSDNPYNTRNRQGLPPTPIANPGLASMQAAAHPADVDYLYFVRKGDSDEHFFTASESEFFAKACEYGFGCG